ncbi:hypothetical protein R3P38DRAFT_2881558 [Favolaschia claudopus]|uniref:Uncharacterized protein n=1 Tax=Favolaschia claudopus TaxID=2862362 RepID=A0AAW0D1S7_9AGAR
MNWYRFTSCLPVSLRPFCNRHIRRYSITQNRPRFTSRIPASDFPLYTISTLDHSLLQSNDRLNFSNHRLIRLRFSALPDQTCVIPHDIKSRKSSFPNDTKGFLYYRHDRDAAFLGGNLRLRITNSGDPASFAEGADFVTPTGMPWQISLPQLTIQQDHFPGVVDQLLGDGLVTHEQVSRCRELFADMPKVFPSRVLFRMKQKFRTSLHGKLKLHVVGHDAVHYLEYPLFSRKGRVPWRGSIIARFEPAENPEYAGRRMVHIRVVKIPEPITSGLARRTETDLKRVFIMPEEGKLLTLQLDDGTSTPWAYDIDGPSKVSVALRALWDVSLVS